MLCKLHIHGPGENFMEGCLCCVGCWILLVRGVVLFFPPSIHSTLVIYLLSVLVVNITILSFNAVLCAVEMCANEHVLVNLLVPEMRISFDPTA